MSFTFNDGVAAGTSTVIGALCQRSDLEAVFGGSNIDKWADLDNDRDAAKILARIAQSLRYVTSYINGRLARSIYQTPLSYMDAESPDFILVDIAANLAGVWLYESRGAHEGEDGTHRLDVNKRRAEDQLNLILAGKLVIQCVVLSGAHLAPEVVKVPVDDHSYLGLIGPFGRRASSLYQTD